MFISDSPRDRLSGSRSLLKALPLLLLPLLWADGAWAAECQNTSYTLDTQAELDALGATGCDSIRGSLTIQNSSDIATTSFFAAKPLGCYGGGGIGGGGMTTVGEVDRDPVTDTSKSSSFAWQAGGGLLYEVTDQVTFDVSYRWYQVHSLSGPGNGAANFDNYRYGASQVMFSLRMFEPLRSLLR